MPKHSDRCRTRGCEHPLHRGGLCIRHFGEDELREQRRASALTALHRGVVDGRPPDDPGIRAELLELRNRWFRVCQVLQTQRGKREMPLDEADFAVDWCIALAEELVAAELALREGLKPSVKLEGTRGWVWGRFRCLEAGLRSNGLPRV